MSKVNNQTAVLLRSVRTIFKKEWREALRDKRALVGVILPAIVMPLMLCLGLSFMEKMLANNMPNISSPTPVYVANLDKSIYLEPHLIEHNFSPKSYTDTWVNAQELAKSEPLIWLPENFATQYQQGEPVSIILLYDSTRSSMMGQVNRLRSAINQLNSELSQSRLMSFGLINDDINPLKLDELNLASEKRVIGMMLSGLPLIILMIIFMAGIGFSVDMTSGERERRTLESLIVASPSHWAVILGKYVTLVSVVTAVLVLFFTCLIIGLSQVDFKSIGISIDFKWNYWLQIALLIMPLVLLAPALQVLIGFMAKSFKEGQASISLLIFLAVLPNIYLLFTQHETPRLYEYIPILYQQIAILDVLGGAKIDIVVWLYQMLLCALIAWLILWTAKRKITNPKTLYAQ